MPGTTPMVGDFLQVRVNCSAGAQLSQNVLHYTVNSVNGGGLTLQQLATTIASSVGPLYRAWMATTATFDGLTVQNLTPPSTDPATSTGSTGAGTATGNLAPRQASGLIRFITGFGGRGNRGRAYIGLIAGSFIDTTGELTGGGAAVLLNVANGLGPLIAPTVGAVTTVLRLMVRHPDVIGPPRTPTGTPVTSVLATALIATQRRRGDFGATNL